MYRTVADLVHGLLRPRIESGQALIMVLALAVGIGANTAIFSLVDTVLWRPLPYPESAALLRVLEERRDGLTGNMLPEAVTAWRENSDTLEALGAWRSRAHTVTGLGDPEYLAVAEVSPDVFPLLRVTPFLGRSFSREDESSAAQGSVIVSHDFWQRRLGGDPDMVGSVLALDEIGHVIVGVFPERFYFPDRQTDMWTVLRPGAPDDADGYLVSVVARLKPDVTVAQAEAEGNLVLQRLESQFDREAGSQEIYGAVRLEAFREAVPGDTVSAFILLQGGMLCFLLIACTNISSMLLTRGMTRRHEWALRAALGATRARLASMSLTETLGLGLAGGGLGLLAAAATGRFLVSVASPYVDTVGDITVDGRIVLFAVVLSLLAGLVFVAIPAWQSARLDLDRLLRPGRSGTVGGAGRRRYGAHELVVAVQCGVAVVLLAGAGLLLLNFQRLDQVEFGFNPDNVLSFGLALPPGRYLNSEASAAFFDELLDRAAGTSGVQSVGLVSHLPLIPGGSTMQVTYRGTTVVSARLQAASAGYSRAVDMRVIEGRWFTRDDETSGRSVVVINRTLARQMFGDQSALGNALDLGVDPMEVVGVVEDIQYGDFSEASRAEELYFPYTISAPLPAMLVAQLLPTSSIAVRTDGDPLAALPFMRETVRDIDPAVAVRGVSTMADRAAQLTGGPRSLAMAAVVTALLALLLAAVGVFGTTSYSISRRYREIGIRIALGIDGRGVFWLVIRNGMVPAAAGAAAGLAAAFLGARVLSSQLHGVSAAEPGPYVLAVVLLLSVALGACLLPARRAARAGAAAMLESKQA